MKLLLAKGLQLIFSFTFLLVAFSFFSTPAHAFWPNGAPQANPGGFIGDGFGPRSPGENVTSSVRYCNPNSFGGNFTIGIWYSDSINGLSPWVSPNQTSTTRFLNGFECFTYSQQSFIVPAGQAFTGQRITLNGWADDLTLGGRDYSPAAIMDSDGIGAGLNVFVSDSFGNPISNATVTVDNGGSFRSPGQFGPSSNQYRFFHLNCFFSSTVTVSAPGYATQTYTVGSNSWPIINGDIGTLNAALPPSGPPPPGPFDDVGTTAECISGQPAITFRWSASSGADSYNIHWTTGGDPRSVGPSVVGVGGTSYTQIGGLSPNTTYTFAIRATNSGGSTWSSSNWTITTPICSTPPGPFTLNPPTAPSCTQVSLSWTPSSGATTYYVLRNGGVSINVGNTTSYLDSGLTGGSPYSYQIRADNSSGSSWSNTQIIITPNCPQPPGAFSLSATPVSCSQINLSWSSASGAVSYEIYRNGTLIGNVGSGTTSFSDGGLPGSSTFTYLVIARNSVGSSQSNNASATTPSCGTPTPTPTPTPPPSGPGPFTITSANPTCSQVSLTWTVSTNAVTYYVFRNGVAIANPGNVISYTDTTVAASTTYIYQIRADNSFGQTFSNAVSVTTLVCPTGTVTPTLTPVPGTPDYTINWTNPADQSVSPGGSYNGSFSVDPVCTSSWSGTLRVNLSYTTTPNQLPNPDTNITAGALSPNFVDISCAPLSGSSSFTITTTSSVTLGNVYSIVVTGVATGIPNKTKNGSLTINPGQFLQTTFGDVYSGGGFNFSVPPPSNKFTSDWLLKIGNSTLTNATSNPTTTGSNIGWKVVSESENSSYISYANFFSQIGGSNITPLTTCTTDLLPANMPTGVKLCNGSVTLASAVIPASQTFGYTGADQTWVVPAGVTSITVDVSGAQGGELNGGKGGRVQTTLAVTPGETLHVQVGGKGTGQVGKPNPLGPGTEDTIGGYNGGGNGGLGGVLLYHGGAGGGASDIRQGGSALGNRVVVGGGGGGIGGGGSSAGIGGGTTGGNGGIGGGACVPSDPGGGGGGGTSSTGGSAGIGYSNNGNGASGSSGAGGNGGSYVGAAYGGGGGGGGYFGGGGGGASGGSGNCAAGGAGGGSSYANPAKTSGTVHTQGYKIGNGQVNFTYTVASANSSLFANIWKFVSQKLSQFGSALAQNLNFYGSTIKRINLANLKIKEAQALAVTGALATAFGTVVPNGTISAGTYDYNLIANGSAGQVTSLGGRFAGTATVSLLNSSGVSIAATTFSCTTGWCYNTLATPVTVNYQQNYTVRINITSGTGVNYNNSPATLNGQGLTMTSPYVGTTVITCPTQYTDSDGNTQCDPDIPITWPQWRGVGDVVYTSLGTPPVVTSPTATNVTTTTVTLGGNITADGGTPILERGTCWNTVSTVKANCLAEGGTSTGVFTQNRTGLPQTSTIYYWAYAKNLVTTVYAQGTLNTLGTGALQSGINGRVPDSSVGPGTYSYTFTPTDSRGQITSLGGFFNGNATVTLLDSAGTSLASATFNCTNTWCYQALMTPVAISYGQTYTMRTVINSGSAGKWNNGPSSVLNGLGLTLTTTYTGTTLISCPSQYTDSDGNTQCDPDITITWPIWMGVGDVVYVAAEHIPSISGTKGTNTGTSLLIEANITSDGGQPILERGTCWNLNGSKLNCLADGGTAMGIFTHNRVGVTSGSTVYIWGYAKNSVGTAYSPTVALSAYGVGILGTLLDGSVPTKTSGGSTLTAGFVFIPNVDGRITALGGYFPGGGSITLYDGVGNALAFSSVPCGINPPWLPQTFCYGSPISIPVTKGFSYRVEVFGPVQWAYPTTPPPVSQNVTIMGSYYKFTGCGGGILGSGFCMISNLFWGVPDAVFSAYTAPVLTSPSATSIIANSATLGASIVTDGGKSITERGVCWNTTNVVDTTKCTVSTDTTANFVKNVTGLPGNATIYYWGYAKNSIGTAYTADTATFKTTAVAPTPTPTPSPTPTPTPTLGPSNSNSSTIFINGDFTIDTNLNYGGIVFLVVNGQIKIRSTVTLINAYLYGENGICTSYDSTGNTSPLVINGGVYVGSGSNGKRYTNCSPNVGGDLIDIHFQRNVANSNTAAEQINYNPSVLTILTDTIPQLGNTGTVFTEVSP